MSDAPHAKGSSQDGEGIKTMEAVLSGPDANPSHQPKIRRDCAKLTPALKLPHPERCSGETLVQPPSEWRLLQIASVCFSMFQAALTHTDKRQTACARVCKGLAPCGTQHG